MKKSKVCVVYNIMVVLENRRLMNGMIPVSVN